MSHFSRVTGTGILLFLLCVRAGFSQYVIVNSEKVPYEDDYVIINVTDIRGDVMWEASKDKVNWTAIPGVTTRSLHVHVDSTAYYRAIITEGTCNSIYSDTVLVAELYDERDDQPYDIVRIGYQWWMAENLNYYNSTDHGIMVMTAFKIAFTGGYITILLQWMYVLQAGICPMMMTGKYWNCSLG